MFDAADFFRPDKNSMIPGASAAWSCQRRKKNIVGHDCRPPRSNSLGIGTPEEMQNDECRIKGGSHVASSVSFCILHSSFCILLLCILLPHLTSTSTVPAYQWGAMWVPLLSAIRETWPSSHRTLELCLWR